MDTGNVLKQCRMQLYSTPIKKNEYDRCLTIVCAVILYCFHVMWALNKIGEPFESDLGSSSDDGDGNETSFQNTTSRVCVSLAIIKICVTWKMLTK